MRNLTGFPGHSSTNPSALEWGRTAFDEFIGHSSGQRILTEVVELNAIRIKHPDRALTTALSTPSCDLLAFATSGKATAVLSSETSDSIFDRSFVPPGRRYGGGEGVMRSQVVFAAYDYAYQGKKFLVYVVHCAAGPRREYIANFILNEPGSAKLLGEKDPEADTLVEAATKWGIESHEEIWVFDRGFWTKDKELYKNVQKSYWDDVILEKRKKELIINDVTGFFDGEASYKEFGVPWKRGIILYGPPGNGKTISIKATMHDLTKRLNPTVEILYVKTLSSFPGPEYNILSIFQKARQMAPCLLVFEDIDSLINSGARSYFLNAVDGLESNHGILMVGSTNHLERLDPGIAKRPSRFDRKYPFDLPTHDERIQYAQYWHHKLRDNQKIEFPKVLCSMIADITDEFSFAYMKEAFIATLLIIVRDQKPKMEEFLNSISGGDDDGGKGAAEKTTLWKVFKKQVKILREEMDSTEPSSFRPPFSPVEERIESIDKSELDLPMNRLELEASQGTALT